MSASDLTLQDLVARSARIYANRIAVVDAAGRYTYQQIDQRARRVTGARRCLAPMTRSGST